MLSSDVEIVSDLAEYKGAIAKNKPIKFILRGIMAGFYLVVAIILSYTTGALVSKISPEIGKITSAMTFSIALALIHFLGGELFTGNNLVMGMGVYSKRVTAYDLLRVFLFSYIGNLIGNIFISFIFVKSGSNFNLLKEYITPIIEVKLNLTPIEMILRGVLCNFIVSISVLANIKMKSESAKMMVMFWCIFAFVIAGFEHCIANMGIFAIGYFMLGKLPIIGVMKSMLWVTLGNILGGTVLYVVTLHKMAVE